MRRPFYVLVFLFGAMVVAAAGLLYWADRQGTFPTIAGGEAGIAEEQVASSDAPGDASQEQEVGIGGGAVSAPGAGGAAGPEPLTAADEPVSPDAVTAGVESSEPDSGGEAGIAAQPLEPETADGAAQTEGTAEPGAPPPSDGLASVEDRETGGDAGDAADAVSGPAFDVVRVEPNGEALMAGRAEPNTEIEILTGDEVIARATTDADGAFLVIPDEPLEAGSHNVTVREAGTDEEARPEQQVAVVIPGEERNPATAEPAAEDPEEQIAALEPQVAEPAELVEAAPSGVTPAVPAEQPAEQVAIPAEPAPADQAAEMPPADLSETPAVDALEAPNPDPIAEPEDPANIAEIPQESPAGADKPSRGTGLPERDAERGLGEQDTGETAPPEEDVAAEPEPTAPGEQEIAAAAPADSAAAEPDRPAAPIVAPVVPWNAELTAVPPGLIAPDLPAEPQVAVPAEDAAEEVPAEPAIPSDAEIAAAPIETSETDTVEREVSPQVETEIAAAQTPAQTAQSGADEDGDIVAPDALASNEEPADPAETTAGDEPSLAAPLDEPGAVDGAAAPSAEIASDIPADDAQPEPAGEEDVADLESADPDDMRGEADDADVSEAPLPPIQLGETEATADGLAAPAGGVVADLPVDETGTEPGEQEIAVLASPGPDNVEEPSDALAPDEAPGSSEDLTAPELALEIQLGATEATTSDAPAPSAEIGTLNVQPDLAIRAAEAEAQTLYVAGEAAPGTMVRIYADEEFVGEAEAGDAGNWLVEARRSIPVGEVTLRADAVEAGGLNPVAQAELPFMRYADGVVLEPVAVASAGGDAPTTVSAELPPPAFIIIRRGDNLWRISRRNYGRGIRYHAIFDANRDRIRNPDLIYPGQVFIVPERDLSWETETN